jgi:hypothetical protein
LAIATIPRELNYKADQVMNEPEAWTTYFQS